MMRRISSASLGALCSALTLFTLPAHAVPPSAPPPKPPAAKPAEAPKAEADPNKAQAALRFDRGLQLFNEGDNAGALAEFKQADLLMPNPIVRYNIGLVYAAMNRPVDAALALSAVVDSATLSPEQRERAQKTLTDQQARIGRVAVSTVPQGARIDVDGVEVARTPLSAPLSVAEGSHVIGAVAEGYAHARKEILVAGNADASVAFELVLAQAKRPANLTVRSRTVDAEVVLDGAPVGKTPLATSLSLPAGLHQLELRRVGYRSAKQQVELGEGATGEVTLDLAVDPQALAREGADLVLEIRESNPDLTIDDEHRGVVTGPLRLPKGPHHVRLQVAGYLPFEQDVTLDPASPRVLRPALQPTPETRKAHDDNVRLHRTWGWVSVGAGVAITGVSIAYAAIAASDKSKAQQDFDVTQAQINNNVGDCRQGAVTIDQCNARLLDAESRVNSAGSRRTLGLVGVGIGASVAALGVVLLATGESAHRFEPAERAAGAQRKSVTLLPGPGQFGLALGSAF